jgi:predicted ribosome quality control (RQC) complex YloA/Tae2 family protein
MFWQTIARLEGQLNAQHATIEAFAIERDFLKSQSGTERRKREETERINADLQKRVSIPELRRSDMDFCASEINSLYIATHKWSSVCSDICSFLTNVNVAQVDRAYDEANSSSGRSTLSLEISEDRRRMKEATLTRLQDDISSLNRKLEALQDENTTIRSKATREVTKARHDIDNLKADLDSLRKERDDIDNKHKTTIHKLQTTSAADKTRILQLEKVIFCDFFTNSLLPLCEA